MKTKLWWTLIVIFINGCIFEPEKSSAIVILDSEPVFKVPYVPYVSYGTGNINLTATIFVPPRSFSYYENEINYDPNTFTCGPNPSDGSLVIIEPEKVSAIIVYANQPYIADVTVYNSVGIEVHHSIQDFGLCGELTHVNRQSTKGGMSWLLWNFNDRDGNRVVNGVYTWRVEYRLVGLEEPVQVETYTVGAYWED